MLRTASQAHEATCAEASSASLPPPPAPWAGRRRPRSRAFLLQPPSASVRSRCGAHASSPYLCSPAHRHLPIASWFARRVRATDKHGHVVLLKLKESAVLLPVYIGEFECTSLVKEINKKPTVGGIPGCWRRAAARLHRAAPALVGAQSQQCSLARRALQCCLGRPALTDPAGAAWLPARSLCPPRHAAECTCASPPPPAAAAAAPADTRPHEDDAGDAGVPRDHGGCCWWVQHGILDANAAVHTVHPSLGFLPGHTSFLPAPRTCAPQVRITALVGNTYHARVHLARGRRQRLGEAAEASMPAEVDIDARPSGGRAWLRWAHFCQ